MKQAISKSLIKAVLITGVVSAAVLAAPGLVTVVIWMLILPGLILGITPSVFAYLLSFSIPWFLLNRLGTTVAIIGGLAAVAGVGFGLPFLLNLPTTYWELQAKAKETRPAAKVAGSRIVALQPAPSFPADHCSDLCQTLLFNGAVERVVLLPPEGSTFPNHLSFRVERMSRCLDSTPTVRTGSTDWFHARDWLQTEQKIRLRIAGGECLIPEKQWTGTPDLTLLHVSEDIGDTPRPNSLAPAGVHVDGLQLMHGSKVIARESEIQPRRLTFPLLLLPQGVFTSPGFEWNRHEGKYHEPVDARPFLRRFTDLDVAPPRSPDSATVAARIDEALADASLPATDGAFGLVHDYFESLPKDHVAAPDVRRLARLISDPRQSADLRLYLPIPQLDAGQRLELRDVILDRMWEFGQLNQWEPYYKLSRHLEAMPAGAFREASPRVERLLSTPEFRRNAPVLAKRLADRGPGEAQRLLSLLREGLAAPLSERHLDQAALHGICRLGLSSIPQGKPMLEALRSLAASGALRPDTPESELWRATMISVGASADEFGMPANRRLPIEQYRRSLHALADNGCEDPR